MHGYASLPIYCTSTPGVPTIEDDMRHFCKFNSPWECTLFRQVFREFSHNYGSTRTKKDATAVFTAFFALARFSI